MAWAAARAAASADTPADGTGAPPAFSVARAEMSAAPGGVVFPLCATGPEKDTRGSVWRPSLKYAVKYAWKSAEVMALNLNV